MAVKLQAASCCGSRAACEECEVRSLAVCQAIGRDQLPRLSALALGRRVDTGQTLFEEGDTADDVFTLTEGMLKLYKLMTDGRRQIIGFLLPGDFLGLAFGRTYVYSAEAIIPTAVCRFRRPQFMDLLADFPSLEKEILGRTSTELAAAQEQMLLLGRKTARERVASFLAALARRSRTNGRASLELPMSRADIADYLGLTIETVSRTLTSFRREGLIDLPDKHQVKIVRARELDQIAGC